jgi:5-methylcytosine-specific restriction endonuclease McrA
MTFLDAVKFLFEALSGVSRYSRFYAPWQTTVWHPIYSDTFLTPEQRRADREAELPDEWTDSIWIECKKFWKGRCAVCGSRKYLQKDHLVPLASIYCPGAVPSNLIPLCRSCNQDKGATDLAEWYQREHTSIEKLDKLVDKIWDWQAHCFERGYN